MKEITLDKILQPGVSFSIFHNEGNPHNQRVHVRAIVDDFLVVYRTWGKRAQYWNYQVIGMWWFEHCLERNLVRRVRKEKEHG